MVWSQRGQVGASCCASGRARPLAWARLRWHLLVGAGLGRAPKFWVDEVEEPGREPDERAEERVETGGPPGYWSGAIGSHLGGSLG